MEPMRESRAIPALRSAQACCTLRNQSSDGFRIVRTADKRQGGAGHGHTEARPLPQAVFGLEHRREQQRQAEPPGGEGVTIGYGLKGLRAARRPAISYSLGPS